SLNPLIATALSLSFWVMELSARHGHPRAIGSGLQPRGPGRHRLIGQPAQCRAKADAAGADQRSAENFGAVVLKGTGKTRRDLAAAKNRPRRGIAVGRVLV